uniref:Signal recognition particle subunit SRP72 n=1 Tax=Strigamia maritima TaxID=126957 RepID=T1IQJ0_STRMM
MAASTTASNLFVELARLGQSGEWEKGLKTANKILHEIPDDIKAFQAKIVCFIQLSQFQEGINAIDKNSKFSNDLTFEKAYCLYRLNKVKEALQLVQTVANPSPKIKELKAQVLYRLEKYDECFESYRDLIKTSQDDYEDERETNLAAVISNLHASGKKSKEIPQIRDHMFELCYNSACALIIQGKFREASDKLKRAEELCRKSLEEDDATEEEIESELAIIRVQLGYVNQMQNNNEQALKLYNMVVKHKLSDNGLVAVASNNIVSINKDQNVFDSKKRIKSATMEGMEFKLTSQQQRQIAINACLLLMHTNQLDQCRNQLKKLQNKYPECPDVVLLLAALHCREKQVNKAIDALQDFAEDHPVALLNIRLTQAQLLLTQGHVNQACEVLRSLEDTSFRPGLVSALVTLYMSMEDKESATKVLNEAVEWYKINSPKARELMVLRHEGANFHLKNNQIALAVQYLEELRRVKPKDMKTLAHLITAYSQINPQKAQDISRELPPVNEVSQSIDVDSLETSSWILGAKYLAKQNLHLPAVNVVIAKKKRKKKKGKLPKSYDSSVDPDPERWVPRRERSTYKKRKDKRGTAVGRGTQGATTGASDMDASKLTSSCANSPRGGTSNSTPTSVSSPNAAAAAQGPRQQRPPAGQKKKKKKGGKW